MNCTRALAAPLLAASLLGLPCHTVWAASAAAPATAPAATGLDTDLFYQLLLAELQLQQREAGAAFSLVRDAARQTQRPELYKRAVEMALQAHSGPSALTAAREWASAHPKSDEPHRFVLQILLALKRPAETGPSLRALVQLSPAEKRQDVIAAIPQTLARSSDKAAVLRAVREALQPYLNVPPSSTTAAAWSSLGRVQLEAGEHASALKSARQALSSDPQHLMAAALALDLLQRGQNDAETLVLRYLHTQPAPSAQDWIQLGYARVLSEQQRFQDARFALAELLQRNPQQAEAWLLQGSLQFQDRDWALAQASLEQFLQLTQERPSESHRQGQTQAYLLLAQMAEQRQDSAAANQWLNRIEDMDAFMAAQLRRAQSWARQGRVEEARALLLQQPERSPEDARRKLHAEAQLLRDIGAYQTALPLYATLTLRFPDDPDLLYEQAMTAEKAGDTGTMEQTLRTLIDRFPDFHHAYNALGYAWADRNERLPEAKALIQRAVEMAPNDAYILDSLGWVEFRLGNRAEALRILQDAYRRKPDAEIAAHLGEVLWSLQRTEEARRIWAEGLRLNPDNDTLRETLQRLHVRP